MLLLTIHSLWPVTKSTCASLDELLTKIATLDLGAAVECCTKYCTVKHQPYTYLCTYQRYQPIDYDVSAVERRLSTTAATVRWQPEELVKEIRMA